MKKRRNFPDLLELCSIEPAVSEIWFLQKKLHEMMMKMVVNHVGAAAEQIR